MSATVFKTFKTRMAERAERHVQERLDVEATIRAEVAKLPSRAAFDSWIASFAPEYRDDMRRTSESALTCPDIEDPITADVPTDDDMDDDDGQ